MSTQSSGLTYEVVVEGDVADELGLDAPIETDHIDYYDTGIWLSLERERVFVPFRTVAAIRELPAPAELVASESGELVIAGGDSETESDTVTDEEAEPGTADRDAED